MLHVHRSDRADDLVAMLADLLAEPLDDPMTAEVVSVPTQGIERWLTQRLAGRLGISPGRHDGVCANVAFPFPGVVIAGALAAASGLDPKTDPWLPERSVWPLLDVVETHFDEPWLAPLARHITNAEPVAGSKHFASVRHVADLFDRYAVHRPDMVQRWAAGERREEEPLWQVELWRLLRARIGQPSPAERLHESCRRLREEAGLLSLPARLSMFGLTRLAASYLDVLEATATGRDVHLFLLHPSPALWRRLEPEVDASSRFVLRAQDETAAVPRNPLLSSWGRDAREMQLVLGAAIPHGEEPAPDRADAAPTLLGRIQDDIRFDRPPVGSGSGHDDDRAELDPDDDSIRVHACHGRGRQVEVLRDAILHLLEADPSLEPRDVIVMCPDIEKFAPLIQATFGGGDRSDGAADPTRRLEIRLADRSLRQTNPVMGVLAEVLELTTARVTATEVLDLAGREPVRRRFRFSDDDLFRLEEWVNGSFVRWGFDAGHRATFHLADVGANTWESGIDRILLGVAMAETDQRLFGGTLPLDDVDSGDIDLAGRMTEFVHRLRHALDVLARTATIEEWAATLATVSDSLTATAPRDAWQRGQLTVMLEELVREASDQEGPSAAALNCDDLRAIIADRLKGKPTRANFRTGHLTVCTLVPMRSIPHRVVCLLGLDDGSFPRHVERDGDDLTARAPRVGDRDLRSEDRQLLLDALLAARDHLVITYTGRDERSNLHRPPAVPIGELLDVVDHTVRGPGREHRASDMVKVSHPLQPFDPKNFVRGRLVAAQPWSFDRLHLDGAHAARTARHAVPAFLERPLPPLPAGPVRIDELERFLRHPVRAFLRDRLGISLRDKTREFDDAIPIELDGLETWQIADRVLQSQLAGASQQACLDAELARGALPPGQLADPMLAEIAAALDALVQAGQVRAAPASFEVRVDLGQGWSVEGTVAGVRGDLVHAVSYSRLRPAARLHAWLRLLALTATHPDRPFEACTIGRGRTTRSAVSLARVDALGPDPAARQETAVGHLDALVDLYRRGMCAPLPLYERTSAAWAAAAASGKEPTAPARRAWTSEYRRDREDREAEHLLVYGGPVSFDDVRAGSGPVTPEEAAWALGDPDAFRLDAYARRLWDGLLAREEVVDR